MSSLAREALRNDLVDSLLDGDRFKIEHAFQSMQEFLLYDR